MNADKSRPASSRSILFIVLGLLVTPVLLDIAVSGRGAPFRYFAADVFYYFTVARNTVIHGAISFDQLNPTNGFHPLWQLTLVAAYSVTDVLGLGETGFFYLVLGLNLVLICLALVFLFLAIERASEQLTVSYLLLPTGLYALIVAPMWIVYTHGVELSSQYREGTLPLYGTLWSFINGMESSPALFFFGLCALLYCSPSWMARNSSAIAFAAALVGLLFSRLDHVFFVAAFAFHLLFVNIAKKDKALFARSAWVALVLAVSLSIYLSINQYYCHAMLPVSGALKSSFPSLADTNFFLLAHLFGSPLDEVAFVIFWRFAQLAIPMLVAIVHLVLVLAARWRRKRTSDLEEGGGRYESLLTITAIGVLLSGVYGLLFVSLFHHGHWYYPVSILFVTLVPCYWLPKRVVSDRKRFSRAGVALATVACALNVIVFVTLHRKTDYHSQYAEFYFDESKKVVAHYGQRKVKLLSHDDGIVAFSLPYPTMSGTGLASDPESVLRIQQGLLTKLAIVRGYNRLTSLLEWDASALSKDSTSEEILAGIPTNWKEWDDYSGLDFEVEYQSEDRRFAIVKMGPKRASRPAPESPRPGQE